MIETCIVCREVPATPGESYCEVCVKTLDNAPESTVEFSPPPAPRKPGGENGENRSADGFPDQSGATPISVVIEESFDEPSGSEILKVTPKISPEKILRHSA